MAAYLTASAAILPGPPVDNATIESRLGQVGSRPSRLRQRILDANGIRARHYAIDPVTGAPTHSAASLCAEAVRAAVARRGVGWTEVRLLSCGTSLPEQVTPGLASLVHGELGGHALEIASTHGVCTSGMTALKYACMAVSAGVDLAVAAAVERASSLLRASHFEAELRARAGERADHVRLDEEFLRWMLSDGAGAVVVEPRGRPGALEVEWIELHSYAHEHPTCMYMGARRTAEGGLLGWRDLGVDEAVRSGAFNLHQDVKLLEASIVPVCARSLAGVQAQHPFASSDVSWFLPHYSSEHFRAATAAGLAAAGLDVPADRWASNLAERGNTGAASVFVMLDELWRSGRVSPGQRLLLMVPESGRFSCAWAMLRAV